MARAFARITLADGADARMAMPPFVDTLLSGFLHLFDNIGHPLRMLLRIQPLEAGRLFGIVFLALAPFLLEQRLFGLGVDLDAAAGAIQVFLFERLGRLKSSFSDSSFSRRAASVISCALRSISMMRLIISSMNASRLSVYRRRENFPDMPT